MTRPGDGHAFQGAEAALLSHVVVALLHKAHFAPARGMHDYTAFGCSVATVLQGHLGKYSSSRPFEWWLQKIFIPRYWMNLPLQFRIGGHDSSMATMWDTGLLQYLSRTAALFTHASTQRVLSADRTASSKASSS